MEVGILLQDLKHHLDVDGRRRSFVPRDNGMSSFSHLVALEYHLERHGNCSAVVSTLSMELARVYMELYELWRTHHPGKNRSTTVMRYILYKVNSNEF